jgi:hypothetical protein
MGQAKRKGRQKDLQSIAPLLVPLQALQNLISIFNDQGVIIGGIAVSLLGTPRYTFDVDAVLLLRYDDLPRVLIEAAKLGLEPRIADPIAFARRNRVLLLRHDTSGIDIDLSLGNLPFEFEMVERSKLVDVGVIQLRLPTATWVILIPPRPVRPSN